MNSNIKLAVQKKITHSPGNKIMTIKPAHVQKVRDIIFFQTENQTTIKPKINHKI